jgi:hypothetical protein
MTECELSDADFSKLVGLARVSEANALKMRQQLNNDICWGRRFQNALARSDDIMPVIADSAATFTVFLQSVNRLREAARDIESCLDRMKIESERISPELKSLCDQFALRWEQPLNRWPLRDGTQSSFDQLVANPRAVFDKLVGRLKVNKQGRKAGRPRTHFYLRAFATGVLRTISDAGGRLTFDKNYPDGGTLVPALRILGSYLPAPGPMPVDLPVSILADVCTRSRKGHPGEPDENSHVIDEFIDRFRPLTG